MTRARETVTLDDLRSRRAHVTRLASRRGGVVVVDGRGTPRFRLVVPSSPLDDGPTPRRRRKR